MENATAAYNVASAGQDRTAGPETGHHDQVRNTTMKKHIRTWVIIGLLGVVAVGVTVASLATGGFRIIAGGGCPPIGRCGASLSGLHGYRSMDAHRIEY